MRITESILRNVKPGEIYHIFDKRVLYTQCIHKIILIKKEVTDKSICLEVDIITFYEYSDSMHFSKNQMENIYSLTQEYGSIEKIEDKKIWHLLLRSVITFNLLRECFFKSSINLLKSISAENSTT